MPVSCDAWATTCCLGSWGRAQVVKAGKRRAGPDELATALLVWRSAILPGLCCCVLPNGCVVAGVGKCCGASGPLGKVCQRRPSPPKIAPRPTAIGTATSRTYTLSPFRATPTGAA